MKKSRSIKTKVSPRFYKEKKPLFSGKEIIFRSQGCAKVFQISSKMQVIFLALVLFVACWSFYSYHMYHKSDNLVQSRNLELVETRDAYVELMTDFMSLHKHIGAMLNSEKTKTAKDKADIEKYRRQAQLVEEKIKQITSQKDWVSYEEVNKRTTLHEAILQRDIAFSERDELKKHIKKMEKTIDELKQAELSVLGKIKQLSNKELNKIKGIFSAINAPLKAQNIYFNPMANSKRKDSKGGPYIPERMNISDVKIEKKVSGIFKNVDDIEYYKEVMKSVPVGKPVWSYWVSSPFGARKDPFRKSKARHKGIDLASRTGNKVTVRAKGKVVRAEYAGSFGNLIVVDHENGFQTKYAHLNKIYVKKGERVAVGDTLGEVGSTGRSTGPHLHYEVMYRGVHVDPLPFLKIKI